MSINFLLKNKIINCEYMTIVKSGDVILSAWLDNFYNNLYELNMDLYLFDLKDEFIIPKNKIERNGQKYVISKSKLIMPFTPGYVDTNIALVTYPLFLGKIWRTSKVMNIILDDDKILYQDIFMFFQMILLSNSIWYTKEFAGVIRRHSWIPEQMDSRRIELLSLTLNKMISRNPYVNGQVLQLLALALENTPKEDRVNYILTNCREDVEFLDKFVSKGLKEKLEKLASSKFTRIDHKDVIDILKKAPVKWEFTPEYGEDIAKEHERYITEYFGGPVFIKNWPKDIKAYYMKVNSDNETVAAVDLEVPGCGELMGGSQREENYEKLVSRMAEFNVNREDIEWYLNLRKYGTTIHSGFGMGFERLIMYLTGMENIRDVIPYPRTPGSCEY